MNMKNTKRMRTFFLGALVLSISAWIGGRQYYLKLNEKEQEKNHIMENIIYNELIIRGYQVDVGVVTISEKNENNYYVRKQLEVDFICNLGYERLYIQSAVNIDDVEKKEQEAKSLIKK